MTIAPLGFALLTALLGVRAGRRTAEIGNRMLGAIVSLATFASLSSLVTFSALHPRGAAVARGRVRSCRRSSSRSA